MEKTNQVSSERTNRAIHKADWRSLRYILIGHGRAEALLSASSRMSVILPLSGSCSSFQGAAP